MISRHNRNTCDHNATVGDTDEMRQLQLSNDSGLTVRCLTKHVIGGVNDGALNNPFVRTGSRLSVKIA